jgi:hypothetical protein
VCVVRHSNSKKQPATSHSAILLAIQKVLGEGMAAKPEKPSYVSR